MESNTEKYTEDQLIYFLSLARIGFLSIEDKKKFEKNLDSYNDLALLSIEEIESFIGHPVSKKSKWDGPENLRMAKVALHYCEKLGIKIIPYSSQMYPEILRQIHNPPYVLFCRGNLNCLCERSVSVVGTRRLTPEGRKACHDFAYSAVMDGCNVISGLANGADGAAHTGAVNAYFDALEKQIPLETLGKTIAVIPSAIDDIVPANNKKLAENILKAGGCIISEYEPGCEMAVWHYVGRNRIIAGLSPVTVVIEAPAGSGALITADFALDFNRDLMFHEVTFGNMAAQISQVVEKDLKAKYSAGKVSKYKTENTAEKFIEAGAPVIKDYKDYCLCLAEAPGKRNKLNNSNQPELFD